MVQVRADYESHVLADLPRGSSVETKAGAVTVHVACKHGHTTSETFGNHFPPEVLRKMLRNKGWVFYGQKATCPVHADNKVKGEQVTQMGEAMKAAQVDTPKTDASVNAKQARREALRFLDDGFDLVKGAYNDGFSDAEIAKATGLSEKAVTDLRAEFGYDIKVDPEIEAIREELAGFRKAIIQFKNEAATAVDTLVKLEAQLAERLTKLEASR